MGFYRLALATFVIITHASSTGANDGFSLGGGVSVFGFYTLSGYLITLTITQNYRSVAGTGYFFLNRALRIYPTYWACLAVAVLIVLALGGSAAALNGSLRMPHGVQWIPNLFIYGLIHAPARLFPPAWSLNIEMVYYLAMGLVLSRHRYLTLAWLALSAGMLGYGVLSGLSWASLYFGFTYTGVCFATGATVCHYRRYLGSFVTVRAAPWLVLLAFVYPVLPTAIVHAGGDMNAGLLPIVVLYVSPLMTAGAILSFDRLGRRAGRLDRIAGDMSYPSFLLHWPVIAAMAFWVLDEPVRGLPLVAVSIVATYLVSLAVVFAVDLPTRHVRNRVRSRSQATEPGDSRGMKALAVPEDNPARYGVTSGR